MNAFIIYANIHAPVHMAYFSIYIIQFMFKKSKTFPHDIVQVYQHKRNLGKREIG